MEPVDFLSNEKSPDNAGVTLGIRTATVLKKKNRRGSVRRTQAGVYDPTYIRNHYLYH